MTTAPKPGAYDAPAIDVPDLREKGADVDGRPQVSERRLYAQLHAYTGCARLNALVDVLRTSGLQSVLYFDVNDPAGVGVLFLTEDPAVFTGRVRDLLALGPFAALTRKDGLTMTGRTYSTGRETDLEYMLLEKPRRTALNPEWPWAVWYPLRRKPKFALLPPGEQGKILHEHAMIGFAYGKGDFAHDIRLACHGLDRDDNEFVIGLVGKDLYPLSRIVQEMRATQQTAKYIKSLGPFFVGRAAWQSSLGG